MTHNWLGKSPPLVNSRGISSTDLFELDRLPDAFDSSLESIIPHELNIAEERRRLFDFVIDIESNSLENNLLPSVPLFLDLNLLGSDVGGSFDIENQDNTAINIAAESISIPISSSTSFYIKVS